MDVETSDSLACTKIVYSTYRKVKAITFSANHKHSTCTQILRLVFIGKEFGKLMSSVTSYKGIKNINIQNGRHTGYIWP